MTKSSWLIYNIVNTMEAEQQISRDVTLSDQELRQIMMVTYLGHSKEMINEAQSILMQCFHSDAFVQRLAVLICNPNEEINIKKAAASLLKNYSFDLSQTQREKFAFMETIFNLVTLEHLQTNIKQLLGLALQYQFNEPANIPLKKIVKDKILERFANEEAIAIFDSCIIIFQAYFNSLLDQPEDMYDFFTEIIQPVSAAALQIYEIICKMSRDQWLPSQNTIVYKLSLLFQFLYTALDNLIQQKDDFDQGLRMIQRNQYLIGLFESYLLLFNNNRSIVSILYPATNKLKLIITNIIKTLYYDFNCPEKMFQVIFITVLLQSKDVLDRDQVVEDIISNCLKILSSHLELKAYPDVFKQQRMQLIFSLLMYGVASAEQCSFIESDPQVFVQLAEEFTEGIGASNHLKVNAASTLHLFADKIDQALKTIIDIIIPIMLESIGKDVSNSDVNNYMQKLFPKFAFYRLNRQQKLQTCLMILCVLSNKLSKREYMNQVVYSFFVISLQTIYTIQSPIVILRIIRAISYFPFARYFGYIQMQMLKGKAFVLQGVKSLQRILRTNKYPQLYSVLSSIFSKLMNVVNILDPVMELIVINLYDKMLKVDEQLYGACRAKIRQQFFINAYKNQHATLICLNLFYSLICKENNPALLLLVEKEFYQISAFIESEEHAELYNRYEEKLIEIYQKIISKYSQSKQEVERFALNSLRHLQEKQKGSQIFRFYNSLIMKINPAHPILKRFFSTFWEQMKLRFRQAQEGKQSLQALPYFYFIISQIIANNPHFVFTDEEYMKLMEMGHKLGADLKQYPLMVLLTILFVNPTNTLIFLKKNNFYNLFLSEISKIKYQGTILKKIFNLAFLSILQVERDAQVIQQILVQSINHMKYLTSKLSIKQSNKIEIKPRTLNGQKKVAQYESIMAQFEFTRGRQMDDNQLIHLFVKFKHPLEQVNEIQLFKKHYQTYGYLLRDLQQPLKSELRMILEIEMVEKTKARIIKKLKK